MKILHYLLGLPPVRGGGLIRYALDLAEAQKEIGCEVALLVPGEINNKETQIIEKKWNKFECYYIKNSLPVSYGKGVDKISDLYNRGTQKVYIDFLNKINPDIIHIHSFMGLHILFLEAAKELNISVIYTTHDYYGLCPKATLMKGNDICTKNDGQNCESCITYKISSKKLIQEQSNIYRLLKSNKLINWLEYAQILVPLKIYIRKIINRNKVQNEKTVVDKKRVIEYQKLNQYYLEMFQYINAFHFNSSQTREVYEAYLGNLNGKVITISNKSISDKRKRHLYGDKLKIGFIGREQHKGYYILLEALRKIYNNGMQNFECHVFFNPKEKLPDYIISHEPYKIEDADRIYKDIDILILPSIWKETFGMVVLEAISRGVPVIISENVGAKEIITQNKGVGIVIPAEAEALEEKIREMYYNRKLLEKMNINICNSDIDLNYSNHVKKMIYFYENVIDENNNI